jgi:putative transposase
LSKGWKSFLRSLADRGLRGVKLVIADDHKGLRAAAAKVFHASLQRCRVHWMRNAFAHVPPKQRPAVVAMLKTIFAQDTVEAAREQWRQVASRRSCGTAGGSHCGAMARADALRERFPKLAELMDASREDVLVYMTFPREHWPQIASTNPLERLNGEIKRRSDVVGIFPNDKAAVRLVGALMLEQNDEWAVSRRYMSLESLSTLSDDPVLRLPAVAS